MKNDSHTPLMFGHAGDVTRAHFFFEADVLTGEHSIIGVQPIANAANRRPVKGWGPGRIGARTIIGCHATVYAGTFIGADCRLGDYAGVREDCRIGDRVVIGTHADIQYGVTIGNDVRILNQTQIAGGTIIGAGTFIGPGVQTANHRHIDLADYRVPDGGPEAPCIGAGVVIGMCARLLPGVEIGDGAVIMAGALVTKNVPAGETWGGFPAKKWTRPPPVMILVDGPLTPEDREALARQAERA